MYREVTKNATQILFQNSLAEVVRKMRANKGSEDEVIQSCIEEIKTEIVSKVQSVKVTAILKASYFAMLGYSVDYGAFNIIEIMADSNFSYKRTGYVAASLTFNESTDVLPLMTAMLKRDLHAASQYEASLALYCLSAICSPDLARDLVSDVVNLLQHPRGYVRRKAVLCLYKVVLQYPEALRPVFPRLTEKLDDSNDHNDSDSSVRGAIVSIFCELARRNPSNFLSLAVPFYAMLSTVNNNWTLIKIIKVFGHFAPLEPRLGKKLLAPISQLISSTPAMSVQYECFLAVAIGMNSLNSLVKLAVEKMGAFVSGNDQNLRYLGLSAMSRLMSKNPKALQGQRLPVLQCLENQDPIIRRKALGLLSCMVTRENMVHTVNTMFDHCPIEPPDEEWSNAVIHTIIETARQGDYELLDDFEWYARILLDLALTNLTKFEHGHRIEKELVTIFVRVPEVRQFGVEALNSLLTGNQLLQQFSKDSNQWAVLKAAAFICGEYPYWLTDKKTTVSFLLGDQIRNLPAEVQVLCVGAVGKILAYTQAPSPRHVELADSERAADGSGELPHDTTTLEDLKQLVMGVTTDTDLTEVGRANGREGGQRKRNPLSFFLRSPYPDVQERAQLVWHHVTQHLDATPALYAKPVIFPRGELVIGTPPLATDGSTAPQRGLIYLQPPSDMGFDIPFCDDILGLMPGSAQTSLDTIAGFEEHDSDVEDDWGDGKAVAVLKRDVAMRVEAQRRQDEARRQAVAAFYLNDREVAGTESQLAAGAEAKAGSHNRTAAASSSRATGYHNHHHNPKKVHRMNRPDDLPIELLAAKATQPTPKEAAETGSKGSATSRDPSPTEPSDPSGAGLPPGRQKKKGHGSRWSSRMEERARATASMVLAAPEVEAEDEAARRMRGIDVVRILAPHEHLASCLGAPSDQGYGYGAETGRDRLHVQASDTEPVKVIISNADVVASIEIGRCQAKKGGGYQLSLRLSLQNLSPTSSLHGAMVRLTVDPEESMVTTEPEEIEQVLNKTAAITAANGTCEDANETTELSRDKAKHEQRKKGPTAELRLQDTEPTEHGSWLVSERLKPTATSYHDLQLDIPHLTSELFEVPQHLELSFQKGKAPASAYSGSFSIAYHHVANQVPYMPSKVFQKTLLPTVLQGAPCFSAVVPISHPKAVLMGLPHVFSTLHLVVVDVLEDLTSLYGQVVCRKGNSDASHLAFLLQEISMEAEEPNLDGQGIRVVGKGWQEELVGYLVLQIANHILKSGSP